MIIGNKKKAVGVILSKFGEEPKEESHEDNSKMIIAKDILDAIEKKSVHDLMAALDAFWAQMELEEGEEE